MTKMTLTQLVAGLMLMLAATTGWAEDEGVVRLGGAGVVRITDGSTSPAASQSAVVRGQSPEQMIDDTSVEQTAFGMDESSDGSSWLDRQADAHRARNVQTSHAVESRMNIESYDYAGNYCPPGYPYGYESEPGCIERCLHEKKAKFCWWLGGQAATARARRAVVDANFTSYLRYKYGYFIPTGCGGKGCPPCGHYSMVYPLDPQARDGRDSQVYAAQTANGPVAVPLAPNVRHTYNYGWGIPSSRLTPVGNMPAAP